MHHLTRLGGTDVLYRTYRFRNDLRVSYSFGRNAPGDPHSGAAGQWDAFLADSAAREPDPLNPHRWIIRAHLDNPNSPEVARSLLELPAAPPQPWLERREGIKRGRLEAHSFRSTILGNERPVWIHTPAGYTRSSDPYGLLVVFDGQNALGLRDTLNNLLAAERIAPLVAVFVDSLGPLRHRELTCHEPLADFLATELMPWVRETHHVSTDPARAVVRGVSYGGLSAAFVALRHPELFGNVISQSGMFQWGPGYVAGWDSTRRTRVDWGWLIKQYEGSPKLPLRFWVEIGLHEDIAAFAMTPLEANRRFRDLLEAKGYVLHYNEFNGGHEPLCLRGSFADALMTLA